MMQINVATIRAQMAISGDIHLQTLARQLDDDGLYTVIKAIFDIEDEQAND